MRACSMMVEKCWWQKEEKIQLCLKAKRKRKNDDCERKFMMFYFKVQVSSAFS